MSVSRWSYRPEVCDGGGCPGDCDLCDKPKNMEDEDDIIDYIKREDAIAEFATNGSATVYGIDKCKAIISRLQLVPSADVVEVVRCKDCIYYETCNLRSSHWWKGGYTVDIEFCSFGERADT